MHDQTNDSLCQSEIGVGVKPLMERVK